MTKFAGRRRGFTLIELLIVIVVIAILALIVIPRVMSAGRKARESTLRANLHQLRNAVEMFQADTGVYPANLSDLTLAQTSAPTTGAGGATIPAGTYQGPYLSATGGIPGSSGIPVNPFMSPSDSGYTTISSHWTYSNGIVHPAVPASGSTLDGVAYSDL